MRNPLTIFPQRLRRRSPNLMRALAEMESEMDHWMQSPLGWKEEDFEGFDFAPTCNFRETDKEYIVEFDIPGVKKDDVKIEMENDRLTVSGERKEKKEEKDAKHSLYESRVGSFMRSFHMPSSVDANKVDAQYEDGVLTIRVPKLEGSKAKEIKIH